MLDSNCMQTYYSRPTWRLSNGDLDRATTAGRKEGESHEQSNQTLRRKRDLDGRHLRKSAEHQNRTRDPSRGPRVRPLRRRVGRDRGPARAGVRLGSLAWTDE